ncbi:nuclease-related domain-containing protein [Jeotgalibacillus haloalkalitolerans]|uniref:Nuclease-related domain-containing protein n=1 Tax=Jeotgalibacillus haloalkalitolerans TaxID=3104292 RepID=A0ABU5KJ18_9BACL|nr:nuclease-related domain-containing protein [Jeotgalibacillus sp. HH7-29]MDZ5711213.1 nuclease-related domain-containing protein [Jeotgalibacillus sp. HH7-29]
MIIKPQTVPRHIKSLEVIAKRLKPFHPKYPEIQRQLAIMVAGHKGETGLDYHLSFIDTPHLTLHNLRLKGELHYFQIDSTLIFSNAIIIIEVKNIAGTIEFNTDFQQVIRTHNGVTEAFKDFHLQTDRQKQQLTAFLKKNKLPNLPVIPLIVMSNSRTIVQSKTPHVLQNVIPAEALQSHIQKRIAGLHIKKISHSQVKKIAELLLRANEELESDWLTRYGLQFHDFHMGVECPGCQIFGMKMKYKSKWECQSCRAISDQAHHSALEELFLLKGEGLTNKDIRHFFLIEHNQQVRRMVNGMSISVAGKTKGTKYYRHKSVME